MNGTTENRTAHKLQGQHPKPAWRHLRHKNFFTGRQHHHHPSTPFSLYRSAFNQRNRTSRSYILRDLLKGIDLHDCGDWGGNSEIWRAGPREGQAGNSQAQTEAVCSQVEFLLLQGSVSSALRPFTRFNQASVLLLRRFSWFNQVSVLLLRPFT